MKKAILLMLIALLTPRFVAAQVSITYTFVNGTTADADQLNANLTQIASSALNRTGGTITGNIAVSPGVTIDGVDIGAVLGGTGTPTFSTVTATGSISAGALVSAGGITAGSGAVGIVGADGRIPALSSTYFASLSGANLTGLSATQITSGLLVPARGGTGQDFSATAQGNVLFFSGPGALAALGPGTAGMFLRTGGAAANPTWSNDGSNLTGLNASSLASGTLPDARLSGTYSSAVTLSNASNSFTGAHNATDGSAGLTSATCNFTAGGFVVKNGLIVSGSGC